MSARPGVELCADVAALTAAAVEAVVAAAGSAIAQRGAFHLALSGGSTPRGLYQRLASPEVRDRVEWSRVQLWFGDERCVPPEHADSNYRMVRAALVEPLGLPESRVHRILGEAPDRALEAARYAEALTRALPAEGGWPCFDLALLGMGADGHTASLFPGTGAVLERAVVVLPVMPGAYVSPQVARITVSAPVLQQARALLLLIAGADKAEALAEVLDGPEQLDRRPLQLVRHARGQVRWLLDPAAAARL